MSLRICSRPLAAETRKKNKSRVPKMKFTWYRTDVNTLPFPVRQSTINVIKDFRTISLHSEKCSLGTQFCVLLLMLPILSILVCIFCQTFPYNSCISSFYHLLPWPPLSNISDFSLWAVLVLYIDTDMTCISPNQEIKPYWDYSTVHDYRRGKGYSTVYKATGRHKGKVGPLNCTSVLLYHTNNS